MANVKISELTAITSSSDLANADIVPIVDSSDSTTKRAALSVLNDFWSSSVWCTGTNTAYLLTDCVGIGTATPGTDIMLRVQGDSCYSGDLKIGGDVCIGGDDLFMSTNTSGYMLIADGTNFNPVAMSGDVAIDNAGATTIQATSVDNSMLAGSIANAKLSNSSITLSDGSNTTAISLGGTMTFSGTSNEIEVAESSGTVTIGLPACVTGLTTVCATNFAGTLATAAQTNVTSLGTLTALTASGNVSFDGGTFVFNESGADLDFRIEGDTDANLFYSDASTDRIGIGTATPDYLLSVAGNAGFNEYIYHNGDADTFIRFETDEINIQVGGEKMISMAEGGGGAQADKVTINDNDTDVDFQVKGTGESNLIRTDAANDRVGIGTSTPDYTLDVAGNAGFDEYIYHNGDADTYIRMRGDQFDFVAGNMTFLTLDESSGASADTVTVNHGDNDIDFLVNSDDGTQLIRTDAENNRVGIGTDSPDTLFHVEGAATVTGNITGAATICSTNLNASSVYIGGTTSANQLDNYVEGTFTPAYTAGSGSITLSTAEGYYTRIGNLIYVTIKMIASAVSSPSGTLVISGLPVASANNTGGEGVGAVVHKNLVIQTSRTSPYVPFELTGGGTDNIPITSVRAHAVVRVVANSTTAKLSYADNDVSYTDAVASDIAADTEIHASFFYQA